MIYRFCCFQLAILNTYCNKTEIMPKQPNTGRKKTVVTQLFVDVKNEMVKEQRVKCIFCPSEIAKNGTRMKRHIKLQQMQ